MSEGGLGTKLHAESGPLTCGYALRDVTWAGAQPTPELSDAPWQRRESCVTLPTRQGVTETGTQLSVPRAPRPVRARPGVVLVRPTPSLAGDSQLNVIEGQAPALPVTLVQ